MPIKQVPLHRSGTCMLVTFSGTHTTQSSLVSEFISLSVIPQMFALISSWLRDFGTPSITHRQKKKKKKTQAKWKMSKSEYSVGRQRNPHEQQYWQSHVEPFRGEAARLLIHSRANKTPKICFFYFATSHSGTLLLLIPGKCYMCFTSYMLISVRL